MSLDQLLLGSAFHLVSNTEPESSGARLTTWGRVASSGFDATEERTALTGTVTTATLGVDAVFSRWLTGLALAYSEGDGSFAKTQAAGGDLASTLTSLHPYVSYAPNERIKTLGLGRPWQRHARARPGRSGPPAYRHPHDHGRPGRPRHAS